MRIEKKREAETAQRKGLTARTIVAVCWLVLGAVFGFLLINWLFASEILTPGFFYKQLYVPGTVDEIYIRIGLSLVVFVFIEFLAIMVFALTNPKAREKSGHASIEAQVHDPFDNYYAN